MKIKIEIQYKKNSIQIQKSLSEEELNHLKAGVGIGNALHYTLTKMEDDIIKSFLDKFTKCERQLDADNISKLIR